MSRRFDAVFIDFYGTIAAGDRVAVEAACRHIVDRLGLPTSARELAVLWGERFFATIERSNHDAFRTLHECELSSLRETLHDFAVEADPVPLVAGLEAYWRKPAVYADAVEFLSNVDLPVCCVSNADTEALATALRRHRFRFAAVVTSEDARCYKPDPAIFLRAAEALGVAPARTLHVGDSLHSDVNGAAKLGIATVWVRREDRIHDIGDCRADHTIRSLADLTAILAG